MQVPVRLGAGLSRLAQSPQLTLELDDDATLEELYARLQESQPELAPALRSALPLIDGVHAERRQRLRHRQEVALLLPISGG